VRKLSAFILVAVLVVGFVVGCGGGEKPVNDEEPLSNESNNDPISGAITLDNLHNGDFFTIEYPNDWGVEEDGETGGIILTPIDAGDFNTTEITVSDNPIPGLTGNDVDELIEETKKQPGGGDFDITKINFNGYDTMLMKMEVMSIFIETYNIPVDGAMPIVTASFEEDAEDAVRDILSTFKLK